MTRLRTLTLVSTSLLGFGVANADTPPAKGAPAPAPAGAKAAPAAANPSADEIMQKVEDHKYGTDGTGVINMEIIPKTGEKRLRRYNVIRKDYGDVIKLVTYVEAPTDVHGSAFMVWDYKKGEDQRWIFLPSVGQVRRLVVGDSRQSYFGSDVVYEDLTNRDPDQDTHKLTGSQKVDSWDCWVIESTPKNAKGLDFATIKSWVTKGTDASAFMVVRQEYKDAAGKTVREGQTTEIKTIDGVPTYMKGWVKNVVTGSETRTEASDVHYNKGIADERFEEAQLSRGAQKDDKTPPGKGGANPGKGADKAPPKGGTPPAKK